MPDTDDATAGAQRNAGPDSSPDDSARNAAASPAGDSSRDASPQRNAADVATTPTTATDDEPLRGPGLRALEETKSEKRRLERELADVRKKLQAKEDAEKTDLEKLTEERDALRAEKAELETRTRRLAVRHQAELAARELNFWDASDVERYIPLDGVEFDDAGEPKGIADAVKQLAKDRPHLVKAVAANGPPATPKSDRLAGQVSPDEERAARERYRKFVLSR
jgi:hypothetical protein